MTHTLPCNHTEPCESPSHHALCRLCFKRLVVSEDAALRFLYERVHEMQDAGYVAYRSQWMAQYQAHIFAAEKLEAMVRPLFPPVVLSSFPFLSFLMTCFYSPHGGCQPRRYVCALGQCRQCRCKSRAAWQSQLRKMCRLPNLPHTCVWHMAPNLTAG